MLWTVRGSVAAVRVRPAGGGRGPVMAAPPAAGANPPGNSRTPGSPPADRGWPPITTHNPWVNLAEIIARAQTLSWHHGHQPMGPVVGHDRCHDSSSRNLSLIHISEPTRRT